jgi:hypothetical protein
LAHIFGDPGDANALADSDVDGGGIGFAHDLKLLGSMVKGHYFRRLFPYQGASFPVHASIKNMLIRLTLKTEATH